MASLLRPLGRSRAHSCMGSSYLHRNRTLTTSSSHQTCNATGITSKLQASPSISALSDELRQLMRRLSHSVVVCTSSLPSPSGLVPRAMTMSSFTSLALAPRPLVTFNVKAPSTTLDAVIASRAFNIHVLAGDGQGARVAEWFTRGNLQVDPFRDVGELGEGWRWMQRGGEPPALAGEGILSRVRCRLLSDGEEGHEKGIVRISDHVIILGEVEEVVAGDGTGADFALTYADRTYRTEGLAIQGHVEPNNKT